MTAFLWYVLIHIENTAAALYKKNLVTLVRDIFKQVADAFAVVGPPHGFCEHHRHVNDLEGN